MTTMLGCLHRLQAGGRYELKLSDVTCQFGFRAGWCWNKIANTDCLAWYGHDARMTVLLGRNSAQTTQPRTLPPLGQQQVIHIYCSRSRRARDVTLAIRRNLTHLLCLPPGWVDVQQATALLQMVRLEQRRSAGSLTEAQLEVSLRSFPIVCGEGGLKTSECACSAGSARLFSRPLGSSSISRRTGFRKCGKLLALSSETAPLAPNSSKLAPTSIFASLVESLQRIPYHRATASLWTTTCCSSA